MNMGNPDSPTSMTNLGVSRPIYLLKLLGVAALYALLAKIVLTFFSSNGVVSIVWPPSGLALAVLLIGGKRYFPGLFLGALLANAMTGLALGVAAAIAVGNTLEAILGAWLLTREGKFDSNLRTLSDYLRLVALGGFVASSVAALNGSAILLVSGFTTPAAYLHNLLHWWMGDALGIILIAPLILVWRRIPDDWLEPKRMAEAILLLGLMCLANQIVFLGWFHDPNTDPVLEQVAKGYWMFLLITLLAIRLGTGAVVIALVMTAIQALLGSAMGVGFLAGDLAKTGLINYWFYMITLSMVGMALATHFAERERAEAELRSTTKMLLASRQLLDSIVEHIPVMVFVKSASELRMELFNRAGEKLLGYTRSDILGKGNYDLWPKEQGDWFTAADRMVLASREVTEIPEEPIQTASGETRYLQTWKVALRDENGEPTHLLGISVDITERKQADEMLRNLSIAVEQSPASVVITDLKACIQYVNSRFTKVSGYSAAEAIGQNPRILQSGQTPNETYLELWNKLNSGLPWNGEILNKRKNGELYWEDVHIAPVKNAAGTVTHYVAVKTDITERKHADDELLRSNAELEQFSYAVSHDMRQPLRMISSYLQLLERSLADQLDGEKRDYFNFAIDGAKRIDQMLMALLEYSRVGRKGEPPTWIESRAVLDEALLFLQPSIAEAQARLNITGEWPRILASHDEILRLLQNLVGNAVKYRIAGRVPEISITGEMVKNEWHLSVADNGVGIIPSQIERLFKVFQRLHNRTAYEGTGIGLALCRKIAEHHKGRIWAESAGEGQGSKFCVVLPCGGKS